MKHNGIVRFWASCRSATVLVAILIGTTEADDTITYDATTMISADSAIKSALAYTGFQPASDREEGDSSITASLVQGVELRPRVIRDKSPTHAVWAVILKDVELYQYNSPSSNESRGVWKRHRRDFTVHIDALSGNFLKAMSRRPEVHDFLIDPWTRFSHLYGMMHPIAKSGPKLATPPTGGLGLVEALAGACRSDLEAALEIEVYCFSFVKEPSVNKDLAAVPDTVTAWDIVIRWMSKHFGSDRVDSLAPQVVVNTKDAVTGESYMSVKGIPSWASGRGPRRPPKLLDDSL